MGNIKIFVSGHHEELESEREIAMRTVSSLRLEPIVYNGLVADDSASGQLAPIEEVKDADIVVFLVWKSLPLQVIREYQTAVLSRKPLIVCVKMLKGDETRSPELIEFLGQIKSTSQGHTITGIQIQAYLDFRSLADLESVLEDSITKEIQKQLRHTVILAQSRVEMYKLGSRIASAAKQRLIIVQKTAVLLLGARDYDAPVKNKVWYEVEYLDTLNKWIEDCTTDTRKQCMYLYEASATAAEIQKYNLHQVAYENLKNYKNLEAATGHRFKMAPITSTYSGPMTVGDSWYAFWVTGDHDAVTISFIHDQVADEVAKVLSSLGGGKLLSTEEQAKQLGLGELGRNT
jgi:hypothetical protein